MESAAISMSCKWAVIFIAKPLGNILMLKQIEQEQQKTISLTASQDAQIGKKTIQLGSWCIKALRLYYSIIA